MKRIALIGSYSPRKCGIATFTYDLRNELAKQFPDVEFPVVAMNDCQAEYAYPSEVRWQLDACDHGAYSRIAQALNDAEVDEVCLQHEYGIFGGEAGAYLLELLRNLRAPVVTTLHTILAEPTRAQRRTLDEVIARSGRIVVMSKRGRELLRDVHRVPDAKIAVVHHGAHDASPSDCPEPSELAQLEGANVLMTFGLLSPDKGVENVVRAMPAVLRDVPNAVYLLVGATHPHVKAFSGEEYRDSLVQLAADLGVEKSVRFVDRYVDSCELGRFLDRADIYVTPYLKRQQITSGTLAYAINRGKAIVSTPYWYAEELLSGDRGRLVPFRDPEGIAAAAVELLTDAEVRLGVQARALEFGRELSWPLVALRYMRVFFEGRREPEPAGLAVVSASEPEVNLAHLLAMTDDTGLLQHATYDVPNRGEGYCLDDNARALLLMAYLRRPGSEPAETVDRLLSRYLAFVADAFDERYGRFRNFMSYQRTWLEAVGSEDSHGRAIWALGQVAGRFPEEGRGRLAAQLFRQALPAVEKFAYPRSIAFALLGVEGFLSAEPSDTPAIARGCRLAERLHAMLRENRRPGWTWFEDRLSYSNARLPQALIVSGRWFDRPAMVEDGLAALEWLMETQIGPFGRFEPIGSAHAYVRGGPRPRFDQQPVDVGASVSACLTAAWAARDEAWKRRAEFAFAWFQGENALGLPLVNGASGGCCDGLHPDRVNLNQGAESSLSYLLAATELLSSETRADLSAPFAYLR